jgi:hypothetical protein
VPSGVPSTVSVGGIVTWPVQLASLTSGGTSGASFAIPKSSSFAPVFVNIHDLFLPLDPDNLARC